MISPEQLRRFSYFAQCSDPQLRDLAVIADNETLAKGETLFEECQTADKLYILVSGSLDLYFRSQEQFHPKSSKEFSVGEINPGEMFGVSALIEPYNYNATARAAQDCELIAFHAPALREMFEKDKALGLLFISQVARVVMERLAYTRIQLAAATA